MFDVNVCVVVEAEGLRGCCVLASHRFSEASRLHPHNEPLSPHPTLPLRPQRPPLRKLQQKSSPPHAQHQFFNKLYRVHDDLRKIRHWIDSSRWPATSNQRCRNCLVLEHPSSLISSSRLSRSIRAPKDPPARHTPLQHGNRRREISPVIPVPTMVLHTLSARLGARDHECAREG